MTVRWFAPLKWMRGCMIAATPPESENEKCRRESILPEPQEFRRSTDKMENDNE